MNLIPCVAMGPRIGPLTLEFRCYSLIADNEKSHSSLLLSDFSFGWAPICDPAGIRTQDPYIKSVMLYQLSYGIV